MEEIHGVHKVLLTFKNIFFCFVYCRSSVLSFLKKSRIRFLQFDLQKKNFVKHIENLPQHLSKKFINDNLSITDIGLNN